MSAIEDFRESSKKISETLRYVSFGIIATDFGILTFKIEYFKDKIELIKNIILISLVASILGILFDYFNALFLFINSKYKYEKNIDESLKGSNIIYFLGYLFFYLKQAIVLFSAALLIIALLKII